MKKMSLLQWLLIVPAFVLLLLSLALSWFVLSFAPPIVSIVSGCVLAVVVLWVLVVRRRGSGPVSEAGLIGRQSSKDGLL